jgi:GNAT superfamily N-acetyltransferase
MSHYADYLNETGSKHILEDASGFATYHLVGKECYIEDIYVAPVFRQQKVASQFAQQIESIAKVAGCTHLTGSVNTTAKNPTQSMKVLLAYGFKLLRSEPKTIWFVKEI